MSAGKGFVHPYVPNAAPGPRARMLAALGRKDVEELYAAIPPPLRFKGRLDLPPPLPGEHDLRQHLEGLLRQNRSAQDLLVFRGAGCAPHWVPALCDEIAGRGEFLTAYAGGTYSDHGKNQALFEFQSMLGELVGLEVVSAPTYDYGAAADSAVLMACRLTGRKGVLVPAFLARDRLSQMRGFVKPVATLAEVAQDPATGLLDLGDLKRKLGHDVAAVYVENPGYLGGIETQVPAIAKLVHAAGALLVVGVDPLSLGVLAAPGEQGADIVVGDIQPLGIHMYAGGGQAGFIACRDEERFVAELPTTLISAAPAQGGGLGFGSSTHERTSYDKRHAATDYYGTTQWLWGIAAAVYLGLLGPKGLAEVGLGVMQRARYAAERLAGVKGLQVPSLAGSFFKEFVVDVAGAGRTPAAVNEDLLDAGIVGGKDLTGEFPGLGQAMLVCVTEAHGKAEIDALVDAVKESCR